MSDADLAARLAAHEHAFEGLLDLIPAKFYNPDDAANQWNKRKQTKEEAKQAKRSKLDPEQSLRRPNQTSTPTVPTNTKNVTKKDKKSQTQDTPKNGRPANHDKKSKNITKANTKTNGNLQKGTGTDTKTSAPANSDVAALDEVENIQPIARPANSTRDITEIRARLAAKIEAMRSKRKAPGTGVDGAPNSRAAILEARRKKEEVRKEKRKAEKEAKKDMLQSDADEDEDVKEEVDDDDSDDDDDEEGDEGDDNDESDVEGEQDGISYGKVAFSDGQRVEADGTLKGSRKRKQQDTKSALQAAMNKKARLAALPDEKRAKIADSDSWHRALLQADGEKVKDDLTLLKKAAKRKEGIKKKSTKEWKERLATIAKAKALKQKNREQNLKDRRESKGKAGGHKKGKQIGAYQGKKSSKGKSGKRGF